MVSSLFCLLGERSNERGISRGSRLGLVDLEPKKQYVSEGMTLGHALLLCFVKRGEG
ncbi:hypothetical protein HMPREF1556_01096 [Porphyromonas sp. oral taxon 278 str. W7784]|nr:hypothetical protein HMPREF1556_01096 [Porphyromonas sp. oral taxon 278 str. W7784]